MDERHDVVIVGGGIMGADDAVRSSRGAASTPCCFEQDPEFGGRDSSKTAGIMRTHYSNPAVVRMAIRGRRSSANRRRSPARAGPPRHRLRVPRAARRCRARPGQRRDAARAGRRGGGAARVRAASGSRRARTRTASRRSSTSRGSGYVEPVPAALAFIAASPGAWRDGGRGRPRAAGASWSTARSAGVETDRRPDRGPAGRAGGRRLVAGPRGRRRRGPADHVLGRAGAGARGARGVGAARQHLQRRRRRLRAARARMRGRARVARRCSSGRASQELPDRRSRRLPGPGGAARPRRRAPRPTRAAASRRCATRSARGEDRPVRHHAGLAPAPGTRAGVEGLLLVTGGSGHGFKLAPAFAETGGRRRVRRAGRLRRHRACSRSSGSRAARCSRRHTAATAPDGADRGRDRARSLVLRTSEPRIPSRRRRRRPPAGCRRPSRSAGGRQPARASRCGFS